MGYIASLTQGAQDPSASQPRRIPSVSEAVVVGRGEDPRRLFVGQLTRDLSDTHEVETMFNNFGKVLSFRLIQEKGICFVQYADYPSANAAIDALDKQFIPGISREMGLNVCHSRKGGGKGNPAALASS